jgi:hypothetical protein
MDILLQEIIDIEIVLKPHFCVVYSRSSSYVILLVTLEMTQNLQKKRESWHGFAIKLKIAGQKSTWMSMTDLMF